MVRCKIPTTISTGARGSVYARVNRELLFCDTAKRNSDKPILDSPFVPSNRNKITTLSYGQETSRDPTCSNGRRN
jgi:hypothetical protein